MLKRIINRLLHRNSTTAADKYKLPPVERAEPIATQSKRKNSALRINDRKHVDGQGRNAARLFRKMAVRSMINGRPSPFIIPSKAERKRLMKAGWLGGNRRVAR